MLRFQLEGRRSKLGRPMNLTIHDDKLYVPEFINDRIQVFSLNGEPLSMIGSPGKGPGQFNAPGGVAVADNGDLFVADFYNHRVQHLRADGSFVQQWGTTGVTGRDAGEFTYPTDVALGKDGMLYVADGYGNRVQAFDSTGDFLHKWGGPNGEVFVGDFYNDRIQTFTARGDYLTAFGTPPENPGHTAMAVDVGRHGAVWSVNFGDNRVEKLKAINP